MRVFRSNNRPVLALDTLTSHDAMFLCAFCEDNVNDCEHFGTCNSITKTCDCTTGTLGIPLFTGALCEKALTCTAVQENYSDILPSGCVGDYTCMEDGNCDCTKKYPDSGRFCQFLPCYGDWTQLMFPEEGCANSGTCSNRTFWL